MPTNAFYTLLCSVRPGDNDSVDAFSHQEPSNGAFTGLLKVVCEGRIEGSRSDPVGSGKESDGRNSFQLSHRKASMYAVHGCCTGVNS